MQLIHIPESFIPPVVKEPTEGPKAFYTYDWYYFYIKLLINNIEKVFLVPCAKTKPIYSSPLHRQIYQKLRQKFEKEGYKTFVVSEPAVLIDYNDLVRLGDAFLYEFSPRLLNKEARKLFVNRLRELLLGKDVIGCLPRHHASLVNDAIGNNWHNLWEGGLFDMIKKTKSTSFW